jgi:hypothetical protein
MRLGIAVEEQERGTAAAAADAEGDLAGIDVRELEAGEEPA